METGQDEDEIREELGVESLSERRRLLQFLEDLRALEAHRRAHGAPAPASPSPAGETAGDGGGVGSKGGSGGAAV